MWRSEIFDEKFSLCRRKCQVDSQVAKISYMALLLNSQAKKASKSSAWIKYLMPCSYDIRHNKPTQPDVTKDIFSEIKLSHSEAEKGDQLSHINV